MPFNLSEVYSIDEFRVMYQDSFVSGDYYVNEIGKIYILVNIDNKEIVLEVPEVWVMTLRSGSDKTNFNPAKDLIKLGLVGGTMYMQYPSGLKISSEYKPSFDTKVILAHAVGNVMIASILDYFDKNNKFSNNSKKNGLSISHWHGYFHPKQIPHGLTMYGLSNPHVSCSSPQSAVYALSGKLVAFFDYFKHNKHDEYIGDIHIEPHHGINVSYPSLTELAEYILNNPDSTVLGNKYLNN